MIIEVRTRTVGYKACVKNSLSFATLPTKPFPRRRHADSAPAEEQTAWEPVHSRRETELQGKAASLLWSSCIPGTATGFL